MLKAFSRHARGGEQPRSGPLGSSLPGPCAHFRRRALSPSSPAKRLAARFAEKLDRYWTVRLDRCTDPSRGNPLIAGTS